MVPVNDDVRGPAADRSTATPWLILAIVSAICFVGLALAVKAGVFTKVDHDLLLAVHRQIPHTGFWDLVSQSANYPLIAVGLGFAGWLVVTGRRREALIALALMGAVTGGSEVTKLFVGERRPSGNGDGIPGVPGAFPSGHELEVLSIWGMVAIRFWRSSFAGWLRSLVVALVAIEVVLVGIARLVLDEHWPMDVRAGFLGGFVVLGLYAWFSRPGGWADHPRARARDAGSAGADEPRIATDAKAA